MILQNLIDLNSIEFKIMINQLDVIELLEVGQRRKVLDRIIYSWLMIDESAGDITSGLPTYQATISQRKSLKLFQYTLKIHIMKPIQIHVALIYESWVSQLRSAQLVTLGYLI